jgi:PhnB protein
MRSAAARPRPRQRAHGSEVLAAPDKLGELERILIEQAIRRAREPRAVGLRKALPFCTSGTHNGSIMPDGYHTATPYLMYRNAAAALDFIKTVFHSVERMRSLDDQGVIRHAEFTIGDSAFMLAQENTEFPMLRSVEDFGGSPVQVFLYLDDVDALAARAVAAGANLRFPVENKTYGRSCGFIDPFGLLWWVTSPPRPATAT